MDCDSGLSSVVVLDVVLTCFDYSSEFVLVVVLAAALVLFRSWFRMRFWSCFGCGFYYDLGLVLAVVLDAVLGLILL